MHSTSDEKLRSRLIEAYEADPDRSKMGRLRKQYDTIIDLKKGGMSLGKILAVLNADKKPEDSLTMKTFNGYLYLLRKERNKNAQNSTPEIENIPAIQRKEKTGIKEINPGKPVVVPSSELTRPPGLSNASWNEMQVKFAKKNRK